MAHPTLIFRHKKENLRKCSLSGLETRLDLVFYTHPAPTPPPEHYLVLSQNGDPLSPADAHKGIILLDATWRYAQNMEKSFLHFEKRSLQGYKTAYPRKQTLCSDPESGLASIEALYLAHLILGRNTEGLLANYYWKARFIHINKLPFN